MGTLRAIAGRGVGVGGEKPRERSVALVWIDSREAIVMRWADEAAHVERLLSHVPAHHRSTGSVRHRPSIRHGGGGVPQTAGEPRRIEHLERFLELVAGRVPADADVLLLGPGTVHEHLGRHIRKSDVQHQAIRSVRCATSPRQTRAQLIARLQQAVGEPPRRRTVGAYRWGEQVLVKRSGRPAAVPVRVAAAHRHVRPEPPPED